MAPENCPNCGADVPRNARACPECGSDDKTGWSDDASSSHLDLPEENFNYQEYVKREFGGANPRPRGISWLWWLTAILLLAAGFYMWFGRR